jgi:hypothetical protein
MNSLIIKDLSITEELDSRAMSAVHGGTSPWLYPSFSSKSVDLQFNTQQMIGQTQKTVNNNGNNAAFVTDDFSFVTPSQDANNYNSIGH